MSVLSGSLFPERTGVLELLGLTLLVSLSVVLSVTVGWMAIGIPLGLILFWFFVRDPVWALSVLILLHFFIVHSSQGITPAEISFAALFFAFTTTWFFRAIFIEHRRIINNAADRFLAVFLSLAVLSIIPAVLYQNNLLLWLRELSSIFILALFFPMKETLKERKSALPLFIAAFMVVATLLAVEAVYNYKANAIKAVYLYQLQSSRQVEDEQVFMTVVIASGAFVMYARTLKRLFFSGLVFSLFALALAVTFSRGYWIAAGIGLVSVFMIAGVRQKVQASVLAVVMTGLAVMALMFLFGGLWETITGSMGSRLLTLANASRDTSLQSRISEYTAALKTSLADPIIGHGFGATFVFYDPIFRVHWVRNFTHNSYIYIMLKLGIVGLGVFVCFLALQLYRAWRLFWNSPGSLRPLIGGLFAILLSLAIVSMSSPQIVQKNSLLIFLLSFSIVSALYESAESASRPGGETEQGSEIS